MFDEAYYIEVLFTCCVVESSKIWNKGILDSGLSFSDSVKMLRYEFEAEYYAFILCTHGSY